MIVDMIIITFIILPLQKKKGDKAFSASNIPNAYGRLEPLPNSPIHDQTIGHHKPLPPMKKFVK